MIFAINPVQEMNLRRLVVNVNAECQANNKLQLQIYADSLQ